MKSNSFFALLALLGALVVSGCVTNRVNWNARIGNYTYDQAIVELGPPDKVAHLSDGRTVAEWVTQVQTGGAIFYGGGYRHHYGDIAYVQTMPGYFEHKFRLTFTPNNILTTWSSN